MRMHPVVGFGILILCAIFVIPQVTVGQPGGFGGFGGKGKGNKGGSMFSDPKAAFENLAKGRGFFLISESRMSQQLADFAKQKGISNGQITLPQYTEFIEQIKSKWAGGGGFTPGKGGFPGGGKPGMTPPGLPPGVTVLSAKEQQNPDILNELADKEFRKRDDNEDGMLNSQEMPGSLRDRLEKYDTNKDNLIDMMEFRPYYIAKLKGEGEFDRGNNKGKKGSSTIIIIEEENWDTRPKVLRAGNLHPDLPSWFKELDTDTDGQVALYEWRAKKPIDEFRIWDTNSDGFITQEEALKLKSALAGGSKSSPGGSVAGNTGPGGNGGGRPSAGGRPMGGGFPGGGFPGGGFPGGKGKGNKKGG